VTKAVINSLKLLDVDTKYFSWITMRRGGISTGLAARVPEPILFLQSGHGSNCAARNYMVPRDPGVLFETYDAFGLERPRPEDVMACNGVFGDSDWGLSFGSISTSSSSNHGQGHQTEWGHGGERIRASRLESHAAAQRFWFHRLCPNFPPVSGRAPPLGSEEGRKLSPRRRGTLRSDTLQPRPSAGSTRQRAIGYDRIAKQSTLS
jgi:hypothetical protein